MIEKEIAKKIKSFDVCALLKLLLQKGYKMEDIYFESHADLSSRATLCENIRFSEEGKVTLQLNLGLLSNNSPLPSFFRKKMDSGSIDSTLFANFIRYFDHGIIKNLLSVSMPDVNDLFFDSWPETQGHYLKLLDLSSTSTLWHLFELLFPELHVQVIKFPTLFKEQGSSIMLGRARLGLNAFLGKKIEQAIPSFKVILTGEDTLTEQLVPWPLEVKRRLKNLLYSILKRTSIHFRVSLLIKNNRDIAKLLPGCYLGYSRIGKNEVPLKLLLFIGDSKDLNRILLHESSKTGNLSAG